MNHRTPPLSLLVFVCALFGLGGSEALGQVAWQVAEGGTGTGTAIAPMGSIQAAIQAASPGDRVLVGPGTYAENLDFLGKDIHVLSLAGPGVTTIDGGGTGTTVSFINGETSAAQLEGFGITGGLGGAYRGGGIDIDNSAATVVACELFGNNAPNGAGLYAENTNGAVYLFNCVVRNNTATGGGGGIGSYFSGTVRMANCLVTWNSSTSGGSGLRARVATIQAVNSAIYLNFGGMGSQASSSQGTLTLEHCFSESSLPGNGNISSFDPGFVSAGSSPPDYRLRPTSLMVDAGAEVPFWWTSSRPGIPAMDLDGQRRFQGHSIDIGPFETAYEPITRHVPQDHATLQAAVNAAAHDDTIIVAGGSQAGFDWPRGRRLKIYSELGPRFCALDGSLSTAGQPIVVIPAAAPLPALDRSSVLRGFRIEQGSLNGPTDLGPALDIDSGSPRIENCLITNNSSLTGPGAVSVRATTAPCNPLFTSCLFADNSTAAPSAAASAIAFTASSSWTVGGTLEGCTIANNTGTPGSVGALDVGGPVALSNSIYWGNQPQALADPSGQVSALWCNIEGGWTGIGNTSVNPLFANSGSGDYHLQSNSPLIDAGNPNSPDLAATDFDGDPRTQCASIDLGVDETPPPAACLIYVGPTRPFSTIQGAINASRSGDTVHVDPGVYQEVIDFKGKAITLQGSGSSGANASIIDPGGEFIAVIFQSGETRHAILRDFRIENGLNPSFSFDPFAPLSSILQQELFAPPSDHGGGILIYNSSPTIEGCVIENCSTEGSVVAVALGAASGGGGGIGIIAEGGGVAAPTIRGCSILNNWTGAGASLLTSVDTGDGGGIFAFAEDENSTVGITLEDCTLQGNRCGFSDSQPGNGGALAVIGSLGADNAFLVMRRCVLIANEAGISTGTAGTGGSGGGAFLRNLAPGVLIEGCLFVENSAGESIRAPFSELLARGFHLQRPLASSEAHSGNGGQGGGLYFASSAAGGSLAIRDSVFALNQAGHVIGCASASCTGNEQTFGGHGGGLCLTLSAAEDLVVEMVNTFVVANAAGDGRYGTQNSGGNGGGAWVATALGARIDLRVNHSTIASNRAGLPLATGFGGRGGGLFFNSTFNADVRADIENSILYDSQPENLFENRDAFSNLEVAVNYSNFEGGWTGVGQGNIALDPQFVDPSVSVDFHIAPGSPCIDAANPNAALSLPHDFDGDPRTIGAAPDMGADEAGSGPGFVHPYPGTRDDLSLFSLVNGVGIPTAPIKSTTAGNTLELQLTSPGSTLAGSPWALGAVLGATGTPPSTLPGFTDLYVLTNPIILLSSETPIGSLPLPVGGVSTGAIVIPPSLSGRRLIVQGIAISATAANGTYAATDAHEIVFR